MSNTSDPNQIIPDPAAQDSGADDTSIVPDVTADPVEKERERTKGDGTASLGGGILDDSAR